MKLWLAHLFLFFCIDGRTEGNKLNVNSEKVTPQQKPDDGVNTGYINENIDGFTQGDDTTHIYGTGKYVEYTAAVLEYAAYNDLSEGGLALLQENANHYLQYAAQAREQGADIIVFPEYGLTSTYLGSTFEDFLSLTQIVPAVEDEDIPCYYTDVNNYTKIMQHLSCGAKELGIYIVVDLAEQVPCSQTSVSSVESNPEREDSKQRYSAGEGGQAKDCPESGYIFYNTQVVFDHLGKVIGRYHKKHVYLNSFFTAGDQQDVEAIFQTHFGVTFTLQVCFDILYEAPAVHNIDNMGIRDVAMSSTWIDELPFLTAPQIWKGWSEGLKVNFLVANYHNVSQGELGSGIFRGVTSEPETYTYNAAGGTTLIVGKVSTTSSTMEAESETTSTFNHLLMTTKPSYVKLQKEKEYERYVESSVDGMATFPKTTKSGDLTGMNGTDNQIFIHEDLENYSYLILERPDTDLLLINTLCHDEEGFCCILSYTYRFNETEEGIYMLFAYSGIVKKGGGVYPLYTQTCAVVFCWNNDTTSCARIEGEGVRDSTLRVYELDGTFAGPYVYPSVFTQDLQLFDSASWTFSINQQPEYFYGSLNLKEKVDHLLSLTMFSRWYSMDP